ncbi:MAG: hypothetical protein LBV00_07875, partial [Propionibacteriaceae bacterium]|nr:hypothetical protein [Propionibacteriaceae bacterium]
MTRMKITSLLILLACALTGCTQPSTNPTTSATTTPTKPSTPTPSPTPTWNPDEQAAVDIVQQYLAIWANIGQNLTTADWNDIWTVA